MTAAETFTSDQTPKWVDGEIANGANFGQFITAIAKAITDSIAEIPDVESLTLEEVLTAVQTKLTDGTLDIKLPVDTRVKDQLNLPSDPYDVKTLVANILPELLDNRTDPIYFRGILNSYFQSGMVPEAEYFYGYPIDRYVSYSIEKSAEDAAGYELTLVGGVIANTDSQGSGGYFVGDEHYTAANLTDSENLLASLGSTEDRELLRAEVVYCSPYYYSTVILYSKLGAPAALVTQTGVHTATITAVPSVVA